MEHIAVPRHGAIYECFGTYEQCLRYANPDYKIPDAKARVYAYCNALRAETKPTERDYFDSNHWNLDAPALEPLKQFLRSLQS